MFTLPDQDVGGVDVSLRQNPVVDGVDGLLARPPCESVEASLEPARVVVVCDNASLVQGCWSDDVLLLCEAMVWEWCNVGATVDDGVRMLRQCCCDGGTVMCYGCVQ